MSSPLPRAALSGRSTRTIRCLITSSVIRSVRSKSAMESAGASKWMMWYDASRYRSI